MLKHYHTGEQIYMTPENCFLEAVHYENAMWKPDTSRFEFVEHRSLDGRGYRCKCTTKGLAWAGLAAQVEHYPRPMGMEQEDTCLSCSVTHNGHARTYRSYERCYTTIECIQNAIKNGWTKPFPDPGAAGIGLSMWCLLGVKGGGTVFGKAYSPKACYEEALQQDPHDANAAELLEALHTAE